MGDTLSRMHPGVTTSPVEARSAVSPSRGLGRTAVSALLPLTAVAVVWAALHAIDTPWSDLARHSAYTVLALVLPGTIVHKALRGSLGSWVPDLALGTALALPLELAGWMIASVLDVRGALWAWPLCTLALFAVPRCRARILERPDRPWPALPLLAVLASALMAFWLVLNTFARTYPLAPTGVRYYPDLLWHMGLAAEARRAFPLGTPQVVGDGTLGYHWFSNAHLAAASLISGSELNVLWLRLWWGPIVMLGVILTAVLAQRLSGSAWAGALAAALAASISGWPFWPDVSGVFNSINALSPSQLFSVPISLLTVHALADLLRRRGSPDWGAAAVGFLGVLGSSGAKASTLPVLLGGVGVAFLAALFLRRQRMLLLGVAAVITVITVAGLLAVSGGGSGQGMMLGHNLTILRPYRVLVPGPVDYTQKVADGLWNAPGVGKVLLAGLMLSLGFSMLRNLALFLPLVQRTLRRDLAAWLLAGACFASFLPFFLLAHSGYSEYYFVYGTIPFGSALWAWSVQDLLRRHRTQVRLVWVTGLVMGLATTLALLSARDHVPATTPAPMLESLRSFVTAAVVVLSALAAVTLVALRATRPSRRALLLVAPTVLLTPFVVGAVVPNVLTSLHPPPRSPASPDVLEESQAGLWIRDHVPERDLMATNIHCLARQGLRCYSRKWWISGIGERRVLIESWGYTPRGAVSGYYDPALYALNDKAFTDPTPGTLKALADKGVTWLVADRQDGYEAPSPLLDELATPRYSNSTITVYELRR